MRFSIFVASSLAATASAAPTWPDFQVNELGDPLGALNAVSQYFNLVAAKVSTVKTLSGPPMCDLSKAVMPTLPGMPPPAEGSELRHVAVGRGTQNYTCDGSADSKPKAVGAVATLFNVTCMAAMYPDVTSKIPGMAVHFNLDAANRLGPAMLPISGHHYFTAAGVPFFDLGGEGQLPAAKNTSLSAPPNAPVGQKGEAAVAWLRLLATKDATNGLGEVFRVSTAGGSPPDTCKDLDGPFQVEYSAELPDLPVEMFAMVISRLSRQDVKHLRLVNRECEAKVSTHYFREVVVPFRSQFFDSLAPDGGLAIKNMSSTMLSNGGRVFDDFGHLIRRFALSLELDEGTLEYPPIKSKQDIIRTFWGLYRWPHARYSRYQDVSNMENDADEFRQMKKALRCLSHVTTLGLCSDVGLGFLSGPMIQARHNTTRHRVFLDPDWRRQQGKRKITPQPVVTVGETLPASNPVPKATGPTAHDWKAAVLEMMLHNAKFKEEQMQAALDLLLVSESLSAVSDIDFDESHEPEAPKETEPDEHWDLLPVFRPIFLPPSSAVKKRKNKVSDYALAPSALTLPQKEMLLELEWAHRAMTQSFILSAVDCSDEGRFQHLTTFNIAKIPSSHLHILSRPDFWKSFPSLRNVSLGVVADWRRVSVFPPGCVEDVSVSPLDAVPLVHALIKDYIAVESKIENFHFEWICGGELASGCHQRNQHILPAPFFASPEAMARPVVFRVGTDGDLLRLPYVKNLSLKNCWVAPHVLLQALRGFALCSLERLEFEGVSLSVMPSTLEHPLPLSLGQLGGSLGGHDPFAFWHGRLLLTQPSWLSWAGLIEHFSPSCKVRDALDRRDMTERERNADRRRSTLDQLARFIPDARDLPDEEQFYKLDSITFKSCGYVDLDHENFGIDPMVPASKLSLLMDMLPTHSEFTPVMQHCKDTLMGRTVNSGMLNDRAPLRDVFRMSTGWDGVYDGKIIQAARADGCRFPGAGRFSGMLTKDMVRQSPK
ncbi:hypothetical protein LLEC1_00864 [Akanthomyces lecanii]|uniref:F-box domain-containing protein n=1 Tax=Cordyceps confragosa TaxID=2714763 RepID=A0A179IDW7_CORDF|nr:hypothetical protein LLEC1_00864 [Akanthomyces lecanii]